MTAILRANNVAVTALVRKGHVTDTLQAMDVNICWGDVTDASAVQAAARMCASVVHCAAATRRSRDGVNRQWVVNAEAPALVWQAAQTRARDAWFTAARPACTVRWRHGLPMKSAPLRPNSPYRRAKLAGERRLASVAAAGSTEWVVARLTSVCGPGSYASWKSLHESIRERRAWLIGAAMHPIHVIDVDDVCQGLLRCLTQPDISQKSYLLAGPEPVALCEFFNLFAAAERWEQSARRLPAWLVAPLARGILRLASQVGWMPAALHSIDFLTSSRAYNITRARRELGFAPVYNTAAAVKRTLLHRHDGH